MVAGFWAAALGSNVDEDSTSEKAYVEAAGWGGPKMWFNRVPEGKIAELRTDRRMHLDVMPTDRTRDDEVERLKGFGATEYEDHLAISAVLDTD